MPPLCSPRRLLSSVLLFALAPFAHADVKLPAVISDHMVLQRDMAVPIWGWATPGEEVSVTLAGQTYRVGSKDFPEQRVIVYFYPAAMTAGCTTQAVDFTAALDDLSGAGLHVLGISPDTQEKLIQFRNKQSVGFPLLSDLEKETLNAYGAYGEKLLYGKLVEGVIRSTFVIDVDKNGQGTVAVAQYNVKAAGHVDKLKRDLGV